MMLGTTNIKFYLCFEMLSNSFIFYAFRGVLDIKINLKYNFIVLH